MPPHFGKLSVILGAVVLTALAMTLAVPAAAKEIAPPATGQAMAASTGDPNNKCGPYRTGAAPELYTACCRQNPQDLGCRTAAPPPTQAAQLVVTVFNSRRQEVRGVLIEVRNRSGRVLRRGTTAGPNGNLILSGLAAGTYRVVGRTPPAQLPLNLQNATTLTTRAGGTSRANLRMNARACSDPGSPAAPATSFAHGGAKSFASSTDDVIRGSRLADVITDPNGNDIVCANNGNDRIRMFGLGRVIVFAGAGNDSVALLRPGRPRQKHQVDGGQGRDNISGSDFDDELAGGPDNDTINGGNGADMLFGEGGNDLIRAGNGRDRAFGNAGADKLFGEGDVDFLDGGAGNDELSPGSHCCTIDLPDRSVRQIVRCGPGNDDELDQRDVYRPFIRDVTNMSAADREEYETWREAPNLIPAAFNCEGKIPGLPLPVR